MYSCCRSTSHRLGGANAHPSRAGCCRCCIGSNRYAICCQLENNKNQQAGRNKESTPTYLIQRPFPPRESVKKQRRSQHRYTTGANPENKTYFSTALARVRDVFLVHWGLGVSYRGFHLGDIAAGLKAKLLCCVCVSPQADTQTQSDCRRSRMKGRCRRGIGDELSGRRF
jgi:hypothetical protein